MPPKSDPPSLLVRCHLHAEIHLSACTCCHRCQLTEKPYFSHVKAEPLYHISGHKACIYALSGAAGPFQFVSGGGDAIVAGWHLDHPHEGQMVARTTGQVFSLASDADAQVVWAGTMQGMLHRLPVGHSGADRHIQAHQGGIFAILPSGKKLLTGGEDGCLRIWDAESGRLDWTLKLATKSIRSIDYSPARNELAIGSSDHCIYLLDAEDYSLRHRIDHAHDNSVFTVRYLPDNPAFLLSGGRDARLKQWLLDGQPTCQQDLPAHMYTINSIAVQPTGSLVATGSRDKTIRIWETGSLSLLKALERVRDDGHAHSVNALRWLDDTHLVSASDDRRLIVWRVSEA